jgi:hypothetical protein
MRRGITRKQMKTVEMVGKLLLYQRRSGRGPSTSFALEQASPRGKIRLDRSGIWRRGVEMRVGGCGHAERRGRERLLERQL